MEQLREASQHKVRSSRQAKLLQRQLQLEQEEENSDAGTSQDREDLENSGLSGHTGPSSNETQWYVPSGSGIQSSASISADAIFFGSLDGRVWSLSRVTGAALWTFLVNSSSIYSSPALFGGSLYLGASNGYLYSLDAATGSLLWKSADSDRDGQIFASPAIVPSSARGPMIIIASGKSVRALFATNASRIWLYAVSGSGSFELRSTVAVNVETGRVFVGTGANGRLLALSLEAGTLIWQYNVASTVLSSPCLQLYQHGGSDVAVAPTPRVYISSADGVRAFGQSGGKLLWHRSGTGSSSSTATSRDSTHIYWSSTDGFVYALSSIDGAVDWKFLTGSDTRNRQSSPVVDTSGVVLLGSTDGSLYALNGSNGGLEWKYDTAAPLLASPALSNDGTVYIGNSLGTMFAIGDLQPSSGTGPAGPPTRTPGEGGGGQQGSSSSSVSLNSASLSPGEIAAAVIFSILGLAILIGAIIYKYRQRSERRERSSTAAALEMARQQRAR